MFDNKIKELLADELPNIIFDEPMSYHTTFKIGGPCDGFLLAECDEAVRAVNLCKKNNIPYIVIGNGSNLLCSDEGVDGLVICIGANMDNCKVDGNLIYAEAGCKLSYIANTAYKNGLGGLEFASGIPGNLGGAVYMNAGAYGGEMKNVIKSVTFAEDGEIKTVDIDKLDFGYRKTYFSEHPTVILSCVIECEKKEPSEIKFNMDDFTERRRSKQPLEFPSAGSFFKRPTGYFAGKLIQDSNLMGTSVGGAEVSTKHAGFIINKGGATCCDVINLCELVKKTVNEKFGVMLEPEVKFIGRQKR